VTDFWKGAAEATGEPFTAELAMRTMAALIAQQDAYYRNPPLPIVYPPFLAKEMRK